MDRLRILAAALACLSISPALAIVGGAPPAPAILTRSVVMVVGSYGTLCTATVIARDLLLTAAHCAQPGAQYQFVDAESGRETVLKDVARVARHPQFELKKLFAHLATADIALLKLADPLAPPFSPLPLDTRAQPAAAGELLTVAGYGVAVRGTSDSGGVLRTAALVAARGPDALQIRLVDPRTSGKHAGLGACTSDSGAPALRGNGDSLAVVGLVSWSTGPNMGGGCGGVTGVTALAPYGAWITDTARGLGSALVPAS
jgi:secreted trypsin-like serine protease